MNDKISPVRLFRMLQEHDETLIKNYSDKVLTEIKEFIKDNEERNKQVEKIWNWMFVFKVGKYEVSFLVIVAFSALFIGLINLVK